VPAIFDAPLAPHHKLIGRWVAAREEEQSLYTRDDARRHIERVFAAAVEAVLAPFDLVDLRVVMLVGADDLPPALALVCNSIGQIDLGWIEKSNILAHTLVGPVAPVGWRAAAYRDLERTLGIALPFFGYADMIEELAAYHWDGSTDDAGAREAMAFNYGDEEIDDTMLPSAVDARRPDWMTAKPTPWKHMPGELRRALKRLRDAHAALKAAGRDGSAWWADREATYGYQIANEDGSHLPPLTLVPFEFFAREIDDVGRFGMEQGFHDVIGLCPLAATGDVDAWFASLRLGADFLLAAKALIDLYPATPGGSS